MKKTREEALWFKECQEKGNYEAIRDRLAFHNGMYLDNVVQLAGLSHNTVNRIFDKLIEAFDAVDTGTRFTCESRHIKATTQLRQAKGYE